MKKLFSLFLLWFLPTFVWATTACSASVANTSVAPIKAAVSGEKITVYDISCSNTSAVGSRIDFLDGATIVWRASLPVLASGGTYQKNFTLPLIGTAGTAFNLQMATTATATMCCISYTTNI